MDLIITDPPYPQKYQKLYPALGERVARGHRDGGSLITLAGHYQLTYVIAELGKSLKYSSMNCLWQEGGEHPRMAMGIEVTWRPILWYVKRAYPPGRGLSGIVRSPRTVTRVSTTRSKTTCTTSISSRIIVDLEG